MPSGPYVVVNEWSGLTGHANMSFYDQYGTFRGTYGQNVGDLDFNPFNGFEGGVFNESSRPGSPINTKTFTLSQSSFDGLLSHVEYQAAQTALGVGYYSFVGENCVDTVDSWLDYAGVSHDMTSIFSGYLLDSYATARDWLVDSWDWVYSQIDGITGFDYNLLNSIDQWIHDFWAGVKALFSSDSDEGVSGAEESLVDTIYSPIAIDIDGNGLDTTSFFDKNVDFDLNGDGSLDKTAWLNPGDAFLAVDLNADGKINGGGELFGGQARGDGYAKLALYDTNKDGIISIDDDAFEQLLIWQDVDSDGVSDEGELRTLAEVSIDSISIQYESWDQYNNGNLIGEHSWATVNGSKVQVGDIYFIADLEAA